jgi:uncharacterized protein (TIGR00269 family)
MATCTLCKRRDAVYLRAYSGEKLCGKCFTKSIEDKVRTAIAKHDMFERDDKIAVAVSGGKDSLTLLHILTKIEKDFPSARLCAVTVDEGIEGYRDEAIKFAEQNCHRLGVQHYVTSFRTLFGIELDDLVTLLARKDKSKTAGLSPCSYCGVLRRRALNVAARKAEADKLALAHNLDDESQTILLNIIHGDPLRLARVKPVLAEKHEKFAPRVKPFCEIPEKEIAFYAYLKEIPFQSVPCPYATTALRNDVRSMLNYLEERHAGTKFTVLRSIARIQPSLEAMAGEAVLRECELCGEPTVNRTCMPCQMLKELGVTS